MPQSAAPHLDPDQTPAACLHPGHQLFDPVVCRCDPFAGRKHYGTGSSRERHDHAGGQSSNTPIASFARTVEPGARHQSEDSGEVAQAGDGRGYEDRADRAAVHRADRGRRGDGCRIPAAHASAFGRLPKCPAVADPASGSIIASPMPTASWHLAPAGCRGRQTQAPEVQSLSHRLLPHRHCRGPDRRGQALPLRRHRPAANALEHDLQSQRDEHG